MIQFCLYLSVIFVVVGFGTVFAGLRHFTWCGVGGLCGDQTQAKGSHMQNMCSSPRAFSGPISALVVVSLVGKCFHFRNSSRTGVLCEAANLLGKVSFQLSGVWWDLKFLLLNSQVMLSFSHFLLCASVSHLCIGGFQLHNLFRTPFSFMSICSLDGWVSALVSSIPVFCHSHRGQKSCHSMDTLQSLYSFLRWLFWLCKPVNL